MLEYATLKHHAGFKTLRSQPGQVDGRIDADGCETYSVVMAYWELRVGEGLELISACYFGGFPFLALQGCQVKRGIHIW